MPFFNRSIADLTGTDLEELLAAQAVENVRLEFKREVPGPEETLKKLSGFANTFGGYLIVGAAAGSSDGRLTAFPGVDAQPNYKQTIVQRCYDGVWPPFEVLVSDNIPVPNSPGKFCYVIYVAESLEAPHFLNWGKGAWIRTDEYSQRFETRLADYEAILHLLNRRGLAVERREALYRRSVTRFETLVEREYAGHPNTAGTIGATVGLSISPHFPTRRLIEEHALLQLVTSEQVPWRSVRFPSNRETVTQHESVLLLHPASGFSMVEVGVWGNLFYALEIERLTGEQGHQVAGIHLYAFLGHVLVFLEHARRIYRRMGYSGSLFVRAILRRVRGKPFIYADPYGSQEVGPSSRIDDEVIVEFSTPADRLYTHRDDVAGDLLKTLFFALNWPDQAADPGLIANLVAKGAYFNSWAPRA